MSFWTLLVSFAPWFSLKIISDLPFGNPLTMLKISIVVAFVLCAYQGWKDKTRSSIFWGSISFFSFCMVAVVLTTNMWVIRHMGVLSQIQLVAIAFGSMAAKRPFTLSYANQHVRQELWNHPRFLRKNYLITGAWGVSFLFCLALAVLELNGHGPGKLLVEILDDGSMLAAMVFTKFLTRHPTTAETPA